MSNDIHRRNYRGFEIVDSDDPVGFDAAWAALGLSIPDVIRADKVVSLYNSNLTNPYRTRREIETASSQYIIDKLIERSCLEPATDSTQQGSEATYRLNLDNIRSLGLKKADPLEHFMQI